MGFNKRRYSINQIIKFAKTHNFEEFEIFMIRPDAYIYEDHNASELHRKYINLNNIDRELMFNNLKEKEEF